VLSTSNHASFTSSIWGRLASAPCDLRLVAEDGMIEAHHRMLFPLSPYHAAVETLPYTAEPIQVVLAGTSIKAVAAVKDLVYTGTCHLDELILPEILETLAVLGIEVSCNSFNFKTEPTDDERSVPDHQSSEIQDLEVLTEAAYEEGSDVQESVKGEPEVADPLDTKEKTEDVVDAFEGIAVGKAFHTMEMEIPKLKIEERLHTKEKIIACDFLDCKITFANKDNLKRHIKNVHMKEKPDQCSQCLKTFSDKSQLSRHIEIVHKKVKPYQCSQCLQKFSVKSSLKQHIASLHNGEKPHECSQCLKKFSKKTTLSRHIEVVHKKVKPYQCSQCLKKFGDKSNLKKHIANVHNGEKPHECSQCLKKFGEKQILSRHMIKVHNIE